MPPINRRKKLKLTIFVIDDSQSMRRILKSYLQSDEFDVHSFSSTEEAKLSMHKLFSEGKYVDLIILDLVLQGGKQTGEDFLTELAEKKLPIQILLISGKLPPTKLENLLFKGGNDYLIKPVKKNEFISTVRKHAKIGREKRLFQLAPWKGTNRLKRDVFISYSTKDRSIVNYLKNKLEAFGISCWYAHHDLTAGDDWNRLLNQAIEKCKVFIVLVTLNALNSKWVKKETRKAFNRKEKNEANFKIIPVVFDVKLEELPRAISEIHYVDITDDKERIEEIQQLLFSIQQVL